MAIPMSRGRYAPIPRPQIGAYHTENGAVANFDQYGQVIPRDPRTGQVILGQGQRNMGATPPSVADRGGSPADNLRDQMFGRSPNSQQTPVTPPPIPNYIKSTSPASTTAPVVDYPGRSPDTNGNIGTTNPSSVKYISGSPQEPTQSGTTPATPIVPSYLPNNPYAGRTDEAGTNAAQVWNDMVTKTNGYEGHPGMMAGSSIGTISNNGQTVVNQGGRDANVQVSGNGYTIAPLAPSEMQRIESQYGKPDAAGFKTPVAGVGPGITSSGAPVGYLGPAATTTAQGGLLPNPVAPVAKDPQQAGQYDGLVTGPTPASQMGTANAGQHPMPGPEVTPSWIAPSQPPGAAAGAATRRAVIGTGQDIAQTAGAAKSALDRANDVAYNSTALPFKNYVKTAFGGTADPAVPVAPIPQTGTNPSGTTQSTPDDRMVRNAGGSAAAGYANGTPPAPTPVSTAPPMAPQNAATAGTGAMSAAVPNFLKKPLDDDAMNIAGRALAGGAANLSGRPNYSVSQ